jgi:hypothetical protein
LPETSKEEKNPGGIQVMRINVYAEELTTETSVVNKIVDGKKFFAVRLFLKSAKELHHTPADDDRSAITFWVPYRKGKNQHKELQSVFQSLSAEALVCENLDVSNPDSEPKTGSVAFP